MINTVIIDDEPHSLESVALILSKFFKEINIVGKAGSGAEAIVLIQKVKPQLVFLDVEMPDATGFDVLEALPERNFDTIFVTAYDKYALKAIKYSAIDYILKPADIKEIGIALKKIISKNDDPESKNQKYKMLFENINSSNPNKIILPLAHGYEFLNLEEIVRIESDGRYSTVHMTNSLKYYITRSLSEIEEVIDDSMFFRPHKSHIINLTYVKSLIKTDGPRLILSDGSEIPLARRKSEEFLTLVKTLNYIKM